DRLAGSEEWLAPRRSLHCYSRFEPGVLRNCFESDRHGRSANSRSSPTKLKATRPTTIQRIVRLALSPINGMSRLRAPRAQQVAQQCLQSKEAEGYGEDVVPKARGEAAQLLQQAEGHSE